MSQPTGAKPWKRANTDWFMRCRWGLFAHYLADTASNLKPIDLTVDDWNRRVDAFDVDGLARQLAATPRQAEVAALCVSELVTNAIVHTRSGRPGGTVTVVIGPGIPTQGRKPAQVLAETQAWIESTMQRL